MRSKLVNGFYLRCRESTIFTLRTEECLPSMHKALETGNIDGSLSTENRSYNEYLADNIFYFKHINRPT